MKIKSLLKMLEIEMLKGKNFLLKLNKYVEIKDKIEWLIL